MPDNKDHSDKNPFIIFLIFLRLGLTSFGGPVAHIGYFRDEFVSRRKWISEQSYADLVALCQFLPGPASSQVGFALGLLRRGFWGAFAAWVGFTIPSAIALILFAMGISCYGQIIPKGVLSGLKIVAVAVVAQAVWGMARSLCTDNIRITIMACGACFVLMFPTALGQVFTIVLGGIAGVILFKPKKITIGEPLALFVGKKTGALFFIIFISLMGAFPLITKLYPNHILEIIDSFYRAGSLVFGGGHVVLPLLQAEVVPPGLISKEVFLAGYGAAQAVPGPLFTFSAFLGASMSSSTSGVIDGMIALISIFAPSFLLVTASLPFWESLRRSEKMKTALYGINSAVVGLLLAALFNPVWTSAINEPIDFCIAIISFVALMFWKLPPWLVVGCTGIAGWLVYFFV